MKIELTLGKDKQFYWRMKSDNNKTIACSCEGYSKRSNLMRAVARMTTLMVGSARVVDLIPEVVKKAAAKKASAKKAAAKKAAAKKK